MKFLLLKKGHFMVCLLYNKLKKLCNTLFAFNFLKDEKGNQLFTYKLLRKLSKFLSFIQNL